METGVSTASLFGRYNTEDAVRVLADAGVPLIEVSLSTFSEYEPAFAEQLARIRGGVRVHSVHALTTQFEPQLFNASARVRADAEAIFLQGAGSRPHLRREILHLSRRDAAENGAVRVRFRPHRRDGQSSGRHRRRVRANAVVRERALVLVFVPRIFCGAEKALARLRDAGRQTGRAERRERVRLSRRRGGPADDGAPVRLCGRGDRAARPAANSTLRGSSRRSRGRA